MKIALASWMGHISPVFDVTRQVLLVEAEKNQISARREVSLPGSGQEDQVAALAAFRPDLLVCGAVSRPMLDLLGVYGIPTVPFTAGPVEEVLQAFLSGRLGDPAYRLPGCCHGPHFRGWGGGGRGVSKGLPPGQRGPRWRCGRGGQRKEASGADVEEHWL